MNIHGFCLLFIFQDLSAVNSNEYLVKWKNYMSIFVGKQMDIEYNNISRKLLVKDKDFLNNSHREPAGCVFLKFCTLRFSEYG